MKRQAIVLAVAAALLTFPLSAAEKAAPKDKVTYTDPAGDVTGAEGEHPNDVVGVDVSSDGKFILVSVTLTEVPKPVSIFQALIFGVAFDVDNSAKTGGQGFGGMHGDLPGIDFESEIISNVNEGATSTSSTASVISVDSRGNQANVVESGDGPATPVQGKTFTGRIAYESLGVKSGQTIRVIPRELDDRHDNEGMFPPAMLTLK